MWLSQHGSDLSWSASCVVSGVSDECLGWRKITVWVRENVKPESTVESRVIFSTCLREESGMENDVILRGMTGKRR